MTDPTLVGQVVRETLARFPLASEYRSEEHDLQPHIQSALDDSLREAFPEAKMVTTISVGGTGKPSLKMFGTSFWPDVEVSEGGTPLVAVEVKLIRPRQSASHAIAEAFGQSVIYSVRYPKVFTFIVHQGHYDDRYHDDEERLQERALSLNVELVIRRPGDNAERS